MAADDFVEELSIPGVVGVQLVISSYGTSIRRRGECFQLKHNDVTREVAAAKVHSILLTTGAHLSTDAVELAVEHNIDIVMVDGVGRPFARLWRTDFGSTAAIRRKQLAAAQTRAGVEISTYLLQRKLEGRLDLLSDLLRARPDSQEMLASAISQMIGNVKSIRDIGAASVDACRNTLMSLEGASGRAYYGVLARVVPDRYGFSSRSPRQHCDPVNAFLNYGYGVLYSRVESACILAGLDPHVGLLHTDRYGKPSMVCDLIEPFRVYAERPVVYLFTRRRVNADHYEDSEDGPRLTEEGRKLLLTDLNGHLEESVRHCARNVKRVHVIQAEAHHVANWILREV